MSAEPRSKAIDDFNASARAARRRSPPQSTPADRVQTSAPFKPYQVSSQGQLTLPASARTAWELRSGGTVHAAHLGDLVLIARAGAWSAALQTWRLEERLAGALWDELNGRMDEG
jgi:hypothetical protein